MRICLIASIRAMPCPTSTSTCRNFVTISSGLCRLFAISDPPLPNYTGGPTRWGRTTTTENDSSTFLDPPDPWPHPVDGGALLDGIAKIFNDHMVLPKGAEDMLALWVLHAHAHKSAGISPTQATRSLPLTLVTVEDFEAGFIFSLFKFHPDPGKGVFNLFVC
jgi:hypothetical protein